MSRRRAPKKVARSAKAATRPAGSTTLAIAKAPARTRVARPVPRASARDVVTPPTHRFIVLTGLSGAGKSQAMRALEDLAYFCVDNLPITLLPVSYTHLTLPTILRV